MSANVAANVVCSAADESVRERGNEDARMWALEW